MKQIALKQVKIPLMKVKRLSINGFRGASSLAEIVVDTSKPVVVIFGENGTGKSTIVDAFDFICNKKYGSLETYSLGGTAKKYVPTLGSKTETVQVKLETVSSEWEASLGKSGPMVNPDNNCPDARILRRRTILGLIESQPKERFEELKAFISVPNIEKSENALRRSVDALGKEFDECVRSLTQAQIALDKLWKDEACPGDNALAWGLSESNKDIKQIQKDIVSATSLDIAFQNAVLSLNALDEAYKVKNEKQTALSTAEGKQKSAETKQAQQNVKLLNLLEDASAYIEKRQTFKQCPVCEQGIDPTKLLVRLTERISEMKEIKIIATVVSAAKKEIQSKVSILIQTRNDLRNKVKTLGSLIQQSDLECLNILNIDWDSYSDLLSDIEATEKTEIQARQYLSEVLVCRESLQANKEADQKTTSQYNAIKGYVDLIKEKESQAAYCEELLKKLRTALGIVSQERKNYIEGILSGISGEVERLYELIHPDENIGKIRFYLDPKTIGSLKFDGQFHDCDELPPQAYYSESHLDTLGICVFLALSRLYKTEKTILILDDVLTSIDGSHLERFMSLIHNEAKHFNQMIITTHYRPWRERYRWAKGPVANTQLIELGPWSLKDGLKTGEFLSAIEELQIIVDKKGSFDRQAAASKAGIVLESLLDFITLKYRCAMPRNVRNEYTLGDLAYGVDSKLSKELRCRISSNGDGKKDVQLKSLLDAATSSPWVRNCVGCHFNTLASEITDQEVKDFCKSVLVLANHLICSKCNTLPTRRPSGSYWQCKCGQLELYPLIYPGRSLESVDDET